jgi:c(7)-type cytochrome triheme protein
LRQRRLAELDSQEGAGRTGGYVVATALALLLSGTVEAQQKFFDLPELPPPHEYGDVLIDRLSKESGEKPVVFSHWSHRNRYTCRVCHFELHFAMAPNASEITEAANRDGEFCGACHDGTTAFGHIEGKCSRCHTGPRVDKAKTFKAMRKSLKLPEAPFGNEVDWVEAEQQGLIEPVNSLHDPAFEPIPFNEQFEVPAAWTLIPPADFSHNIHLQWLECASCHPDVFKIQKKATEHFLMVNILEGKFCGACHMKVAFPLDDCKRCHPSMKMKY